MTLKKLSLLTISFILLIACETDPKIAVKKLTVEELKEQLKEVETKDSLKYISVKQIDFSENRILVRAGGIFRSAEYETDGWIILGELTNSALLANFKDVVVTVSYYSQTKSLIEQKDIVIYDFLKPNSSIGFNAKVEPPEGTNSISLLVKSVIPLKEKTNREQSTSKDL